MDHDDIHDRLFARESAKRDAEMEAQLAQTPTLLRDVEHKRAHAFELLQRLDFPRNYGGGLYPTSIDRYGKQIAAWRLDDRYDEGYQTTTMYLTADGDLIDYKEEFSDPHGYGGHPYTYENFTDAVTQMELLQKYRSARDISKRLDYLIECLEERLR